MTMAVMMMKPRGHQGEKHQKTYWNQHKTEEKEEYLKKITNIQKWTPFSVIFRAKKKSTLSAALSVFVLLGKWQKIVFIFLTFGIFFLCSVLSSYFLLIFVICFANSINCLTNDLVTYISIWSFVSHPQQKKIWRK